jgi:transposase InsO family protein
MEAAPVDLYKKLKKKAKSTRDRDVRIKIELFLLALKLRDVSEACARRGFSRKFYYKWWNRFEESGFELKALEERSRRPKRSPNKTPAEIESKIRWFQKKQHGSRQIEAHLKKVGSKRSRRTICHILNGRKKIKRGPKARLKTHQKRYELPIPGQRFQMDVKYVPCLIDFKKAYSYVIVDECTRWRFAKTYHSLDEGTTILFLDEFEKICPFPIHTIQTDNGQEFTYKLNPVAQHLEHKVDTWCNQRGIRHRLIPPGVKELNGKVERSHRIDMQYFYWKAPSHCLEAFNRAQRAWMAYYNSERLHGGLGFITPLEKLRERSQTLKTEKVEEKWDAFRLKFLKSRTIVAVGTKQDWQIQSLEAQLTKLLKEIA